MAKKPIFHQRNSVSGRTREPFHCSGDPITKQHHKNECDINLILSRYQKTGVLDHVKNSQPDYADLSDYPNYHDSMNAVIEARDAFLTLDSSIRKKFANDPSNFLDFVSDPKNEQEMIEMGLITKSASDDLSEKNSAAAPPVSDQTSETKSSEAAPPDQSST